MPTELKVKKLDGKAGKAVKGSDKLFGASVNHSLIHQAIQTEATNSRQGTQSTKTRGEVRHTTRKPYKQKGTGRARQGMTSAPHYRHGGIAMGPKPRVLHASMPKKMRRAAIASALTAKAQDSAILITDVIDFDQISTKKAASLLSTLELSGRKVLLVLPEHSEIVYKSFRNIPGLKVRVAPAFSTRDIIDAETIVFSGDSLGKIELIWLGSEKRSAEGAQAKAADDPAESGEPVEPVKKTRAAKAKSAEPEADAPAAATEAEG